MVVVQVAGPSNIFHQLMHRQRDIVGLHHMSDILGGGTTLSILMILSENSRILLMNKVPMPEPVPLLSEWVSWKPWRQSAAFGLFVHHVQDCNH